MPKGTIVHISSGSIVKLYRRLINENNTPSQTSSTKYLAVYLDDKLTWSDHFINLEKTVSHAVL